MGVVELFVPLSVGMLNASVQVVHLVGKAYHMLHQAVQGGLRGVNIEEAGRAAYGVETVSLAAVLLRLLLQNASAHLLTISNLAHEYISLHMIPLVHSVATSGCPAKNWPSLSHPWIIFTPLAASIRFSPRPSTVVNAYVATPMP